jgi:hypothetical protein
MGDRHGVALVAALVESIDSRSVFDADRLVRGMVKRSWPGGSDRIEPGALEWVRRWGLSPVGIDPPDCACDTGRCKLCN